VNAGRILVGSGIGEMAFGLGGSRADLRQISPDGDFSPKNGNPDERLVSDKGWRYHPRFDFSGLFCAQSGLKLAYCMKT
jgi:hypothetical protein